MIKEYRNLRKLSQEELAEIIGISTRQIQRIENNESGVSLKTLRKLIKALAIKEEDIIKIIKEDF